MSFANTLKTLVGFGHRHPECDAATLAVITEFVGAVFNQGIMAMAAELQISKTEGVFEDGFDRWKTLLEDKTKRALNESVCCQHCSARFHLGLAIDPRRQSKERTVVSCPKCGQTIREVSLKESGEWGARMLAEYRASTRPAGSGPRIDPNSHH